MRTESNVNNQVITEVVDREIPLALCSQCEESKGTPIGLQKKCYSSVCGKGTYYTCTSCGKRTDDACILERVQ